MKYILIIFSLTLFSSCNKNSQSAVSSAFVSDTMEVKGVCGQCKKRIEKAALSAGAISANWDVDTDLLKVRYKSSKTSSENITAKVLSAGHKVDGKAPDMQAYAELPGCCKYMDGVEKH